MTESFAGNVFLVGPMGAGKTAVGKRLAARLHRDFYDSDHQVEASTGVDISFIFEKEGEAGFRRREAKAIDSLTSLEPIVLATGGGAVLDPANRERLSGRGYVVYLCASVDEQLERTRRGSHRPLLETGDRRGRLESLMAIRDPLYREVARYVVATDKRRVPDVVEEIYRHLVALDREGG